MHLIAAITLDDRLEALGLQRIKTDSDAFHTRSLQAVNAVGATPFVVIKVSSDLTFADLCASMSSPYFRQIWA